MAVSEKAVVGWWVQGADTAEESAATSGRRGHADLGINCSTRNGWVGVVGVIGHQWSRCEAGTGMSVGGAGADTPGTPVLGECLIEQSQDCFDFNKEVEGVQEVHRAGRGDFGGGRGC